MAYRLLDETIREGEARGFHPHTPEERLTLLALIQSVTGTKDFAIGFASMNTSAQRTLHALLGAIEENELVPGTVGHVYFTYQSILPSRALVDGLALRDRRHVAMAIGVAASTCIAGPTDGPWLMSQLGLPTHSWRKMDERELHERFASAAGAALRQFSNIGLSEVSFIVLDAFRAPERNVRIYLDAAVNAGASSVRLHDTVGIATPALVEERITSLKRDFPSLALYTHFHDDFSLAVANTLAALECGAAGADVTVNGIGNRAGNATTQSVLAALRVLRGEALPEVRFDRLQELARETERYYGLIQSPFAPVTGSLVHVDEASFRTHLVLAENDRTFLPYSPSLVGASCEAVHTEGTSKRVVGNTLHRSADVLDRAGVPIDDAVVARAFSWVERTRDQRAATHRGAILATIARYESELRHSYVSDADVVAEAVASGGLFDR